MDFFGNQNFNKSQIVNMVIHRLNYFPSNPQIAQMFYHITNQKLYIYKTSGWVALAFGDSTSIPAGIILAWPLTLAEIPVGWALCDGTSGTPNLIDRFVKSIPASTNPGTTGGAMTHVHSVSNHTHTLGGMTIGPGGNSVNPEPGGTPAPAAGHTHSVAGAGTGGTVGTVNTTSAGSLPNYFEVAYIIKT